MRRSPLPALLLVAACTTAADAPSTTTLADDTSTTTAADTTTTEEPIPTTSSAPDPSTTTSSTTSDETTSTTTSSSTTTDTTSTTTGLPLGCGDGIEDPDEECDHGPDNSDDGDCTLHCKLAVCGDGLVAPFEQCDEGPDNADNLYGVCTHACKLGPHCGDGIHQPEEECDLGGKNGGDENGSIDGVPCTQTCHHKAALVFLSHDTFTISQLGGAIYNVDKLCQKLAADAKLRNAVKFKAWIGTDNGDVKGRFQSDPNALPYALPNGKKIAANRTALFQQGPITGITRTEKGSTLLKKWVWTDTNQDGTLHDAALDCDGWASDNPALQARVGRSGVDENDPVAFAEWKTNHHWTSYVTLGCDNKYHLYCFED